MKAAKCNEFIAWSYENTLDTLANRFPDRILCLCKPSYMHLNNFACFDNFVEKTTPFGDPKYSPSLKSVPTLSNYLHRLCKEGLISDHMEDISVVGFSKGCIVLNQLLYEVGSALRDESLAQFIAKFREFYWLDAGHNGKAEIWLSDLKLIETFAKLNPRVYIGVTPYQMKSAVKPLAAKEKARFVQGLQHAGVNEVEVVEHFFDVPPSLENHFKILSSF